MKQNHRTCMVMAHSACKVRIAHCFIISEEWHHGDKECTPVLGWQTGGQEHWWQNQQDMTGRRWRVFTEYGRQGIYPGGSRLLIIWLAGAQGQNHPAIEKSLGGWKEDCALMRNEEIHKWVICGWRKTLVPERFIKGGSMEAKVLH